jgi:hypothetical protein
MALDDGALRLLVRGRDIAPKGELGLGLAAASYRAEPLFRSIGKRSGSGRGLAAAGAEWSVVTFDAPYEAGAAWDACHAFLEKNRGKVDFAEPDLVQRWTVPVPVPADGKALGAVRTGDPHPQDSKNFPAGTDNLWFRDAGHGQFADAAALLPDPGPGKRVRIAHLDTGYDPDHKTCPIHISADQHNFVEDAAPDDARDRSDGLFNNFSHGTGTLSILAGAPVAPGQGFGCAPYAEIIPIRVANRVVLFRNSAIAQAFDYVHQLCQKPATRVHVVTMSMGGYPTEAWAAGINALYEAGVLVVTAAGNNYGNAPAHFIVYPARFDRVVAACGVMADGKPYADLDITLMGGDYGPDAKMAGAIAAYTPNVPWARFGEESVVDYDGQGTSAATPQVAAAAALWIQKNRAAYEAYPEPWMRVEAVRQALFKGADSNEALKGHLGAGRLRAKATLDVRPPAAATLQQQPKADASNAAFHILFGLAAAASPSTQGSAAMIELELRQALLASGLEEKLVAAATPQERTRVLDQLMSSRMLSKTLRAALGDHPPAPTVASVAGPESRNRKLALKLAQAPTPPRPPRRRLRIYATDPTRETDVTQYAINEATLEVKWEDDLRPGPIGEYLQVVDVDPSSRCCYAPVDLNHPYVLAKDGLAPSESNPQFHQQMVYAVASTTIERFEHALGRRALWAQRLVRDDKGNTIRSDYVQRLRIYPHALREANAYYSSDHMALLLGYFHSDETEDGMHLPGSQIFCAVSHDIIAHETTHALLDGLHPRYQEATNPDMLAFHEAFADLVALFQHFSMPESLLLTIKQAQGNVDKLGELAQQFGTATGMHGALRSFIGQGKRGDYTKFQQQPDPHLLGAVLVSAVFAAFTTIYRARTADLIRLATGGSGILPQGAISADLAQRLANEAAKVANQILNMCIRALDYCPPVDLTFGDYLRAIITADHDLVPDDDRGYRVAFISAFRDRGIFPLHVAHLAEDSLLWETPQLVADEFIEIKTLVDKLTLDWNLNTDRRSAYQCSRQNGLTVWEWLTGRPGLLAAMGFEPAQKSTTISGMTGELRGIEVHSVRPSRRTAPDGTTLAMLVVEITQTFRRDPDHARYRGGCTLLVDLATNQARYFIRKRLNGGAGLEAQRDARALAAEQAAALGMRYAEPGSPGRAETFALLHRFPPGEIDHDGEQVEQDRQDAQTGPAKA